MGEADWSQLPAEVEALRRRLFEYAVTAAREAGLSWYWLTARPGGGPFDSGLLLERAAFARLRAPLEARIAATAARLILPGSEAGDPDPHPRLVVDGTTLEEPLRAELDCHQGISLRLLLADRLPPGRLERSALEFRLRRVQAGIWALLVDCDAPDPGQLPLGVAELERLEAARKRSSERGRERLEAAFRRRAAIFARLEALAGDACDAGLPDPGDFTAADWLLLGDSGQPQDFPAASRLGPVFVTCPPADYSGWWFDAASPDLLT
ncbi:MAG: hypothetical protein QM270_04630 [Bacillota bacterium]|nr:hypothetical protein [Bacillota bacterium]